MSEIHERGESNLAQKRKSPNKPSRSGDFLYDRKYTSPRVDIIFKRVFGTERNKPILQEFLSVLLGIEIIDLRIENTECKLSLSPSILDPDILTFV